MTKREASCKFAVLFAGTILLSLLIVIIGGESALADSFSKDAMTAGSWSLQFGIQSSFRLGVFDGYLISCKRHYSPNSAIRLGLTVRGDLADCDDDDRWDRGLDFRYKEVDGYSVSFSLVAAYQYYANPQRRVKLYYTLGPSVGGSRSRSDSEITQNRSGILSKATTWRYSYSVYAGLLATLGTEWFVAENISLLAEYGVTIRYLYGYQEDASGSHFSSDIDRRFEFIPRGVLFGLSVYF